MSSYIVYGLPKEKTCMGDVKIIADFQGEKERNFQILVSPIPNSNPSNRAKTKEIYYMIIEEDKYPVFITKAQVNCFTRNLEKAKEFVYNIWMDRYK